MIPSPIHKALSTIRKHRVGHLLMGGQACVLYGAAEFSRDLDLVLLRDDDSLNRLSRALTELEASVIAIPAFETKFLDEGLAVHFRCEREDVRGLRIDVMTRLRGVDEFDKLWERRTTFVFGEEPLDVLSLPDLVTAKKTQRDKDWPMIRRLVEVHYWTRRDKPDEERIAFWLMELRTPEILAELARSYPDAANRLTEGRPLLEVARDPSLEIGDLRRALRDEEEQHRQADEAYWRPLRKRLETLRRDASRRRQGS